MGTFEISHKISYPYIERYIICWEVKWSFKSFQTYELMSVYETPLRDHVSVDYRQVSNMRRTKSQNLNLSRLVLQLSLLTYWSHVLSREWRFSWSIACRHCSNYIWVINNSIAHKGASYIRDVMVVSLTPQSVWCKHAMYNDITYRELNNMDSILFLRYFWFYLYLISNFTEWCF